MPHHQIRIACRDSAEAEMLRATLGQPSALVFTKSSAFLESFASAQDSFLVMTSLIMDETANGLLTKAAIIHPTHAVVYACHADRAMNVLRLFGCGCAAVLGPGEIDLLTGLMQPSDSYLNELVMPPFFIDDDESSLKAPPDATAKPLHITFLGAQAIMSCANALLNINASRAMSMSCVAPPNKWALGRLISSLEEHTLWSAQTKPEIGQGSVTLCADFDEMTALIPTFQHIVICHGLLSDAETSYLGSLSGDVRVYTASNEGYLEKGRSNLTTVVGSQRLWDALISTLYGD